MSSTFSNSTSSKNTIHIQLQSQFTTKLRSKYYNTWKDNYYSNSTCMSHTKSNLELLFLDVFKISTQITQKQLMDQSFKHCSWTIDYIQSRNVDIIIVPLKSITSKLVKENKNKENLDTPKFLTKKSENHRRLKMYR